MHPWFGDKPFLTSSAFSTMCFLDRWARGMGGHWLDYVERFIERKQRQNVAGLRIFDETTYWNDRDDNPTNDHKFFNEHRATSLRMWDYGALRTQARPHGLTAHHQTMLLELFRLLRKHGMRGEVVVDATLKHSPGVGWKVIGQCVKKVAKFCDHVHRSEWDDEDEDRMGSDDPAVNDRLRAAFEAVKGPINHLVAIETHNEADAHSRESWEIDGLTKEQAFAEVNAQLGRMSREDHWPGGAVWVSEGGDDGQGRDLFEYDFRLADCIAVHPSRPSMDIGDRFNDLVRASERTGLPVYANEPIHFIDPALWWMVEQEIFRPGSSTKDARKRMQFFEGMLDMGFYVCDHSLVGMANGVLFDDAGSPSEMPLDAFELMLGGTAPPPPQPEPVLPYERLVRMAYADHFVHEPDPAGLKAWNDFLANGGKEWDMRERMLRDPHFLEVNG